MRNGFFIFHEVSFNNETKEQECVIWLVPEWNKYIFNEDKGVLYVFKDERKELYFEGYSKKDSKELTLNIYRRKNIKRLSFK